MISGFTARNLKLKLLGHPIEDAYGLDLEGGIIAVADGVTRDPMEILPDRKTIRGKLSHAFNFSCLRYQNPSPAGIAANMTKDSLVDVVKAITVANESSIRVAFWEANEALRRFNDEKFPHPDYVKKDLASCVAAMAIMKEKELYGGYICDCGIAVVDEKGNLVFRTENDGPDKHDAGIWASPNLQGRTWNEPEARRIVRSQFRNNLAEKHSFGVLNGQPEAMDYVRTFARQIDTRDTLLVYSDGVEGILFKQGDLDGSVADCIKYLDFRGLKKLCQKGVRTEGTLVYSIEDSALGYRDFNF